jgi:DNA processing protein
VGRRLAREAGRRLAARGHTVITGLAYGVDKEATLGALEARGRVVAVLPYLLEEDGSLNSRASWLLRAAASRGASASAVAENLVKDGGRVRAWLAMRNEVIAQLAKALVVPEARFKAHWGTRYAVEHALAAGRPVVVLEPRVRDGDVAKAFEYFSQRGALTAEDVGEAIRIIERRCRPATHSLSNIV